MLAATALHHLPLFLVQAMVAFSVGVTATISAVQGTRLVAAGWAILGTGALGLAMLGVAAAPTPATALPEHGGFVLLATPVLVVSIGVYETPKYPVDAASARVRHWPGFCMVGVATPTLMAPDAAWQLAIQPLVWALVLNGVVAAVLFALSPQHSVSTAVAAIMFTTHTALSSLIGIFVLDDHVRPGFTAVAVVGFACAVVGAVGIAQHAAKAQTGPRTV